MTRALLLLCVLAACGPKHASPPPADDEDDLSALKPPPGPEGVCEANTPEHWASQVELSNGVGDTEIERRQNAACDKVMPKLTACAVEDACAKMAPKDLEELDLEHTAPVHLTKNLEQCMGSPMSSRQVRVYEVCSAEETECGPLAACLEHAKAEAE